MIEDKLLRMMIPYLEYICSNFNDFEGWSSVRGETCCFSDFGETKPACVSLFLKNDLFYGQDDKWFLLLVNIDKIGGLVSIT